MMKKQMSDTFIIGILLAIVGGFLDTYTYTCRGQVFANAQTGNIILFGIQAMQGNFSKASYYLFPILSFSFGIIIAEIIRDFFLKYTRLHWRQVVLGIELLALVFVAFLAQGKWDMLCNIIISFICALQVESFRKFNGNPYASTMCTGNLRSATEHLYKFLRTKEKKTLYKSLQYYTIILFFIFGACFGVLCTRWLGTYASFIPTIILFLTISIMFYEQVD